MSKFYFVCSNADGHWPIHICDRCQAGDIKECKLELEEVKRQNELEYTAEDFARDLAYCYDDIDEEDREEFLLFGVPELFENG